MTSQNQRLQINLNLSLELYKTIDNLSQQIHGDHADVFLKALALLEIAVEAKQQGKHLWIVDDNQNLDTEISGI
ncbi:DNA-binding protein [Nostoc sp. CENA543]|uniref:DNA-binding protein n=1 Tax=Nostoc sp. CENA543 TaxID=1869241 RepID=UPI000CA32974|nr:DNA-binding protein [Nostoc sp. CENA543]AUT02385.1 DNA-binding protein [Nostoc sp. CENA543]